MWSIMDTAYWCLDNIHLIYIRQIIQSLHKTQRQQQLEWLRQSGKPESGLVEWKKLFVFFFFLKYIWEKCASLTEWCCCGSLFLLFYHSMETNMSKKTGYTKNQSGKQQKTFFGHKSNNTRMWKEKPKSVIQAREVCWEPQTKVHLEGLNWEDCGRGEVLRCMQGLHVANA